MRYQKGFTIVELLIVIVVIAILAAITIVAYNGIQNRANDTAVQTDLANYSKKTELFNVDNGRYPVAVSELSTLGVRASQSAYNTSYYNLYYCTQTSASDKYVFAGRSKSGTVYYTSSKGIGNLGNISMSATPICNVVGITYGTDSTVQTGLSNTGVWAAWAL
ncbi:General secretion pathway protein G [Candidatus Saccharibacteria bacterium RAAC3_TM7_1]|nr:General secretion pathway protein G [Candidatus Saccharibacteria bacterium RAAC3_TM7_1]HCZ28775.1 prepilin-type N-terminal cleavage/methylation domain-containing protein [Candidatus Saccharibacteria bacterium]